MTNQAYIDESTMATFAYAMRTKIKRHRPIEILLVEDDASDVMLTGRALDDTHIPYNLHNAHDGNKALSYLRREGAFADAVQPDIVLLDLGLPECDGFEMLTELTKETAFNQIPIVILTVAADSRDILHSYDLWLSDYVAKPCTPEKLLDIFGKLHSPDL